MSKKIDRVFTVVKHGDAYLLHQEIMPASPVQSFIDEVNKENPDNMKSLLNQVGKMLYQSEEPEILDANLDLNGKQEKVVFVNYEAAKILNKRLMKKDPNPYLEQVKAYLEELGPESLKQERNKTDKAHSVNINFTESDMLAAIEVPLDGGKAVLSPDGSGVKGGCEIRFVTDDGGTTDKFLISAHQLAKNDLNIVNEKILSHGGIKSTLSRKQITEIVDAIYAVELLSEQYQRLPDAAKSWVADQYAKVPELSRLGVPGAVSIMGEYLDVHVLIKKKEGDEYEFLAEAVTLDEFLNLPPLEDGQFYSIEIGGNGNWQVVMDTTDPYEAMMSMPAEAFVKLDIRSTWTNYSWPTEIPHEDDIVPRAQQVGVPRGMLDDGFVLVPISYGATAEINDALAYSMLLETMKDLTRKSMQGELMSEVPTPDVDDRMMHNLPIQNSVFERALRIAGVVDDNQSFSHVGIAPDDDGISLVHVSGGEEVAYMDGRVMRLSEEFAPRFSKQALAEKLIELSDAISERDQTVQFERNM